MPLLFQHQEMTHHNYVADYNQIIDCLACTQWWRFETTAYVQIDAQHIMAPPMRILWHGAFGWPDSRPWL